VLLFDVLLSARAPLVATAFTAPFASTATAARANFRPRLKRVETYMFQPFAVPFKL